jgi:hypothetical protein
MLYHLLLLINFKKFIIYKKMLWEDICGRVVHVGSLKTFYGYSGDELPSFS